MTFPAADTDRLTAALAPVVAGDVAGEDADLSAALAYLATAEGSAAAMAERACDRAGIDYAACPVEILDAAEKRAESLELAAAEAAPVVAPEVQAPTEAGLAERATNLIQRLHRNCFDTNCDLETARKAVEIMTARIAATELRPRFRGQSDMIRALRKECDWIKAIVTRRERQAAGLPEFG